MTEEERTVDLKLRIWSELRAAIVHEDDLINHRFTWLLTFEGFLLAGFFAVQSSVLKADFPGAPGRGLEVCLFFAMLGSIPVCFFTGRAIAAAQKQVVLIAHKWRDLYPEEKWQRQHLPSKWYSLKTSASQAVNLHPGSLLPPIYGTFSAGKGSTRHIPLIFMLINTVAVISCLCFVCMK